MDLVIVIHQNYPCASPSEGMVLVFRLNRELLETSEITIFNLKSKEKVFELQVNKDVLFWVSVGVPIYYIL